MRETQKTENHSMWQNRDYVRLLLAQVISLIGTGVSSVCLALLAYELAGADASQVLSIAFAIKMFAYIVLAPLFGALNHRLNPKSTLIILDLLRGLTLLLLPWVVHVWQVYLLMFVIHACSAAFTPLYQAVIPIVLPNREDYTKALSYSRVAFDLEQVISPLLTALMLLTISFRTLFLLDAGTFVISAILIALCQLSSVQTNQSFSPLKKSVVTQSLSNYLAHSSLRTLWFAYLAAASAGAMVLVNTVVYVSELLVGNEAQTALALFVVGLGSIAVAFALPKLLLTHSANAFHLPGIGIICTSMLIGMLTPDWPGFIALCLGLGVGMSLIQTTAGLIITAVAGQEQASAYFAAHFSLTHFWWLITYLCAGFSAAWLGLSGSFAVMLSLCLFSLIAYWRETRLSDLH